MNTTAAGIYLILTAIACISLAQACNHPEWLKSFVAWYEDKNNPWPVWLFTLGFIALICAFFN